LSPRMRFKVFFAERDAFNAYKTSLFISIIALNGIE
jgi:hypothetical protein